MMKVKKQNNKSKLAFHTIFLFNLKDYWLLAEGLKNH